MLGQQLYYCFLFFFRAWNLFLTYCTLCAFVDLLEIYVFFLLFFSPSAFDAISLGFTIFGEIFAYVTFFLIHLCVLRDLTITKRISMFQVQYHAARICIDLQAP